MSDVLINGMKMPKSCQECFWVLGYDSIPNCPDIETSNLNDYLEDDRKGRHPNCPLVEVKPHGRLIDADNLTSTILSCMDAEKQYSKKDFGLMKMVINHIIKAPTVLEASE